MGRTFLFMAAALSPAALWAQVPDAFNADRTGNWESIAAGGGRFFFALIAGILLAYAFQWILTCISLATGATALKAATGGAKSGSEPAKTEGRPEKESGEGDSTAWKSGAKKVEAGIGGWALATMAISTFLGSWLAAELLRFGTRPEAVILGLSVWAGFMLSMLWLEASAFGSLLGSISGAVKEGLKAAAGPLKAAAGTAADAASASADSIAAKVREEFRGQGGTQGLKEKLREYAGRLDSGGQDRFQIESEADRLFEDGEIRAAALQGNLGRADRRQFREMVASRGDISAEEAEQWANALQGRWESLREESRSQTAAFPSSSSAGPSSTAPATAGEASGSALDNLPVSGETASAEASTATGRSEALSPFALASEGAFAGGGSAAQSAVVQDFKARLAGFKEFLRLADRRDLNPVRLEQEVGVLIRHPEEGNVDMEKSARSMKREEVAQVLRQRKDLSSHEAESIADLIDSARTRMLSRSEISEHRKQESTDKVLSLLRDRVYSLKRPERDYESIGNEIARIMEDPAAGLSSLKSAAGGLDRESLINVFYARKGISRQDAEKLADQAEKAMNKVRDTTARIEEETRRRVREMGEEAARQAEATRQVAASAAWWLCGIAAASGVAGALGGLLGANT